MDAKFPEDQKSIHTSSIKCLNFKIYSLKLCIKKKVYELKIK